MVFGVGLWEAVPMKQMRLFDINWSYIVTIKRLSLHGPAKISILLDMLTIDQNIAFFLVLVDLISKLIWTTMAPLSFIASNSLLVRRCTMVQFLCLALSP